MARYYFDELSRANLRMWKMAKGAAGGEGTRKTANACTQGEARGALRAYPSRDEGTMVLDKSERGWTYIEFGFKQSLA